MDRPFSNWTESTSLSLGHSLRSIFWLRSIFAKPASLKPTSQAILSSARMGSRCSEERAMPGKCSNAWLDAGRTGAKPTGTSRPSRTARRFMTNCVTCSRTKWPHPTRRSGSTPAYTTPTASPVLLKAISTSIRKHAKS